MAGDTEDCRLQDCHAHLSAGTVHSLELTSSSSRLRDLRTAILHLRPRSRTTGTLSSACRSPTCNSPRPTSLCLRWPLPANVRCLRTVGILAHKFLLSGLFVVQGHHRVHQRGAAGWDVASS